MRNHQSIIGTITQLFFAWRVHVLTKNRIAVALLFVGSIISCRELSSHIYRRIRIDQSVVVGGIATSIAIGIVPEWLEFQKVRTLVDGRSISIMIVLFSSKSLSSFG